MKKIKYLLWFFVVWVWLFINQSFWQLAVVDYVSTWNKNLTFYLWADFNYVSSSALQTLPYSYAWNWLFSSFDYLNFWNYSYYTWGIFSSLGSYGFFNLYWANKNLALVFANRNSSTSSSVGDFRYYRLWWQSSFTSSDLISWSSNFYLSILWNNSYDNCFSVNTPLEWFCNPIWYNIHYFPDKSYTLTDVWLLEDWIFPYSWQLLSGDKSAVVYSLYNTYSFFSHFSVRDRGVYRDLWYFRTVYRKSDWTFDYINGAMFMRLNNNDPVLTWQNFQIIGITSASWTLNTWWLFFDYYFNSDSEFKSFLNSHILKYSLYTCPYNSRSVFDCTFNKWGVLTTWSLTNSVYSGFLKAIYYLYDTRNYIPKIIVWYNSELNYISLDWIFYDDLSDESSSVVTTYFYLWSNDWYNMLDWITPPEDPLPPIPDDPPTPPIPDDPVYTWQNIISFSSLYYQCLWPSYNTPDWLPPAFCLNPDWSLININDYKDCYFILSASWDIMENMYCDNWGYVQEMAWVWDWSWGYYSACYWDDCWVMFSFWPSYLNSTSTFYLSTWLIDSMLTNVTGWIARCPWPYTDFQLWKNWGFLNYLKSLGFSYDPFIFINCVVAWFHEWRHTIDFRMFDDTFQHPLMYWDSDKHKTLFSFLDFVVILWLFGLVSFFKKIF